MHGRLQVVATPIGNLADLSARAREALSSADVIAAEDTRRTRVLLTAIGIANPLVSLHEHNESQRTPELLARLAAGETIALVSDAGTPLLPDPGLELVQRAVRAGFEVHAIPGPSAITSALAVAALAHEPRTLVFFEAPHRILRTLADMAAEFGAERPAAVARELTKAHETIYRATLQELLARAQAEENLQRGEITLVVHGATAPTAGVDGQLLRRTVELLSQELPPGRVAAIAAQLTGATRAAAYALATRSASAAGGRGTVSEDEEMP